MITNRQDAFNKIEANYIKKQTTFRIGDTIKVHFKIKEGKRERIQIFQGIVIAISGSGLGKTFIIRKISFGVGVERVFPFNSPKIGKIEVVKEAKVRRAKLYYLRNRIGKAHQTKTKVKK